MADIPPEREVANLKQPSQTKENRITVTPENASVLTVHYLSQIYSRLGYIVKMLEEKK